MRSDEDLMEAVASGQFGAFEELVRRHQETAWSVAYHLLQNADRAEEIVQESFLKILRNARNYHPTASFKTYLTRVTTRLCYDRLEKNHPINFDPEKRPIRSRSDSGPLQNALDEERKRTVREAVRSLPPRQQTAIVLQQFEGFTYEEIAETMETTEKAVERLLSRARKNLREALQEFAGSH